METTMEKPQATGKRDWAAIRDQYIDGKETLKEIATRLSIPMPTIRDRCVREGWAVAKEAGNRAYTSRAVAATRDAVQDLVDKNVAKATTTSLLEAQSLIRRTLNGADTWLNRIDRVAGKETHENPDAIRKLTGAWKDVISVARLTHGLDQTGTQVNIAIFGKPVAVESEAIETVVQVSHPQDSNTPSDLTADS